MREENEMSTKGMACSNNSVRSGYTNVKLLSGIMVACVLVAACLIMRSCAQSEAIEISFDKTKQVAVEHGRRNADAERIKWFQREQSRFASETNKYFKLAIPDLTKKAVCCLAIAEKPEYIVNKAIEITEKELDCAIVRPPWTKTTDPDKHVFWSIVFRETRDANHDWWIEQNKLFGQYRLVGNPNQRIYFSINDEDKLRVLLGHIAIIANSIMPKPFYQVIDGDDDDGAKAGCRTLSLAEAKLIFPETVNARDIRAGVYAIHPGNAYALVPLKDYFATLVLDKGAECIVLLGKMGAKSVRVSRTNGEVNLVGGELGAAVAGRGASAGGRYKSVEKSRVDFDVVFEGRPNAKISKDLLRNSIWHKTDSQLNVILAAQLSDNKLKEFTVNESQQSECDFDFKTAARLLGVAEATLKAEFEKTKEVVRKFHVTF